MVDARLSESRQFKSIIDAVKDFTPIVVWKCSDNGIVMQAMDVSKTSICMLNLRSSFFDSYRCDEDIEVPFCITSLAKILKCAGNDDKIGIKTTTESDVMIVRFMNSEEQKKSVFELNLTTLDEDPMNVDDYTDESYFNMESKTFRRVIHDLSIFGDQCKIDISENSVKFHVEGDNEIGHLELKRSDNVDIVCTEPVSRSYSFKNLLQFIKASSLSDHVQVHLSKDHPLMVEYSMEESGTIRYYVASVI